MLPPNLFVKNILNQILLGFLYAIQGFVFSWNNNYIWKKQKHSLVSLLICTFTIYIILVIAFLPLRIFVWIVSFGYTLAPSITEWFGHVLSARTILFKLLWFIPLLAVFVMNNMFGYDKIFFSALASVNPSLAQRLNSRSRQSFGSSLYFFLRRTLRMFAFVTLIHILRSIPYLGPLIPSLWAFKYASYTITNTKHIYLRATFFILLLLLIVFKSLHPYAMSLLHLQMASTALARELFDTYLSRIHTRTLESHHQIKIKTQMPPSEYYFLGFHIPKLFQPLFCEQNECNIDESIGESSTLPHRKISHFLRENYFLLLAFALPYMLLFSIPILGFFCIGFAHGAAAYTLAISTK